MLFRSVIYFLRAGRGRKRTAAACLIFLACCVTGRADSFAFWEQNLAYEGESVYNYLQVKEDDRQVILSTNVLFGVQSILKKDGGLTGMYYDYALAAPFMADVMEKEEFRVLILGNGTGTFASQCRRYFDSAQVEGVEIDEKITGLARQYFELPEEVKVYTYDGRAYLNVADGKYDVVMVDAYQDITIPFQMSSKEFFTLVKEHLTEDGVMVVNMNMRGQTQGNINQYLADTIASVFDEVYTADVPGTTNRELYASNAGELLSRFSDNRKKAADPKLFGMMRQAELALVPYRTGGYLMTDDRAPVELLGMKAIDDLIFGEIEYYKQIVRQEGISGLLKQLQ